MSMDYIPLAGVIGTSVVHSKSPRLHRYWLRRYGLRGDYVPLHVTDANLAQGQDLAQDGVCGGQCDNSA